MTADSMTLEELIQSLSNSLIKEILDGNSIKYKASKGKKYLADLFAEHADRKGLTHFYESLDKDVLRAALECVDQAPDHNNKQKMLNEFRAQLEKNTSFEDFLQEMSKDVLEQLCAALGFQTEGSEEEMMEALIEEVSIAGARELFNGMTKDYLLDCAHELKIKTTGSKTDLINRVLAKAFPVLKSEPASSSKQTSKPEVEKVPIKKGISRDELFQSYYLPELKEYCKKEGIKISGTRKQLADRILKYLSGETETVKAGGKKKRRKRADWKPPTFKGRRSVSKSTKKRKREEGDEEEEKKAPAKKAPKKGKTGKKTAKSK
eukprot:gb/GECH01011324.1/.p1 GENE.gb/GECH01011324.1/~~gb/GECH01011324.1/.p1  ORF type:complete len:320 (+),score=81.65 gb/GECH01011324.1/:1-960(+)